VPVLITNAKLYTVRYKATEVPLDTGRIPALPADAREVEWLRFQKAFTSSLLPEGDRSVFVVYAPSFPRFLQYVAAGTQDTDERSTRFWCPQE
jgi:hypothetical protein